MTLTGKSERATISLGEDGKSMSIHWEISPDGTDWLPLCDLTGTRLR